VGRSASHTPWATRVRWNSCSWSACGAWAAIDGARAHRAHVERATPSSGSEIEPVNISTITSSEKLQHCAQITAQRHWGVARGSLKAIHPQNGKIRERVRSYGSTGNVSCRPALTFYTKPPSRRSWSRQSCVLIGACWASPISS